MINPDELAICKRRGHEVPGSMFDGWSRCKWCGMWVRKVYTFTTEEQEGEPPKGDKSVLERVTDLNKGL